MKDRKISLYNIIHYVIPMKTETSLSLISLVVFMILISPLFSVASIQGQEQQQPEKQQKFFMILKLRNPHPFYPGAVFYDIYNLTTNLKKFPSSSETDKTVYNLTCLMQT